MLLFDTGRGRVDPYWNGIWSTGPRGIMWTSAARQQQFLDAGLAKWVPKHLAVEPTRAAARLTHAWEMKLAVLGALNSWRTLTAEQLGAITGFDPSGRAMRTVLADLYALGAVDAGFAWTPGTPTMDANTLTVYKLGDAKTLRRVIQPEMTYPELIAVTGTGTWRIGYADRHDLLSAEIGIRLAEFGEGVAMVLGEAQSRLVDMVFHGPGFVPPAGFADRPADMTLVRADGGRIAFEMTTSRTSGFAAKLASWARAIESHPWSATGVAVVVLAAPDPNRGGHGGDIRKALSIAIRARPGNRQNPTAARMLYADWRDWFPEQGKASPSFFRLRAHRLEGDNWVPVDLVDDSHLPAPEQLRDPMAVVRNASGLWATPAQLKVPGDQRPRIAELTMKRTGIPLPAGKRSNGRIGASGLPQRLRF